MGVENQCEAMVTKSVTGRRCRRPALPDTDPPRCERHYLQEEERGVRWMHGFYRENLQPKLAALVAEQLELGPMEQMSLHEELALIRAAAGDAVQAYAGVVEAGADVPSRMLAGSIMTEALQRVTETVEKCARVEDVKARVSGALAGMMHHLIVAVVRAASETFGNDYRIADFERRIRERLEATSADGSLQGTLVTPDQDVIEMDDTIPRDSDG